MSIKIITPEVQYDETNADSILKWLAESKSNGLHDYQLTDMIRLLIDKCNELAYEVNSLNGRVEDLEIQLRLELSRRY